MASIACIRNLAAQATGRPPGVVFSLGTGLQTGEPFYTIETGATVTFSYRSDQLRTESSEASSGYEFSAARDRLLTQFGRPSRFSSTPRRPC